MPKFRNIRVKMKGGKSRLQRAMVLASGKLKFVKNIGRGKSSTRTSSPKKKGSKGKYMTKKKTRRSGGMTIPIAPILGIIGAPAIAACINDAVSGQFQAIPVHGKNFIGIDGSNQFNFGLLLQNITPIAAGILIHKFIGGRPLNVNGMLARAKIPFIRI